MNNLVSIIIPAYNVEKYIKKCIKSCINQSYRNIEILIINDGSKDNTPKIIDDISQKDTRIKVFHRENHGVSDTRNYGIKNAMGEFIIFLDADDYLSEEYVQYMLNLLNETESDFAFSKVCFTNINQSSGSKKIYKIDNIKATALLLSRDIEVGCWNKIYKKSLLLDNNIFFSNDLFFGEGLHFITKVAQYSKNVGVGEKRVYYYRKNNINSATTSFNYNKIENGEKSLLRIFDEFILKDKSIILAWEIHYCFFAINSLISIINNSKNIENYELKYKYWNNIIRKYSIKIFFQKNIKFKTKIKILLMCLNPKIVVKQYNKNKEKYIQNSV